MSDVASDEDRFVTARPSRDEGAAEHCVTQLPSTLAQSREPQQVLYPLTSRASHEKPCFLGHSIEIQAAGVADPATTISLPTPSFVCRIRGRVDGDIRTQSQIPNTTILSRRSITDIKWLNNANATAITRWGSLDTNIKPGSSVTRLSDCDSKFSVSTLRSVKLDRRSNSSIGTDTLKENAPETPDTTSRHSIEFFPALLKREWAQDWLSPPADLSNEPQEPRNDLYHLGIDARCGSLAPVPAVVVIEEPIKPRQCNHALFHENIFECGTYSTPVTRRATEASIKVPPSPELNSETSIGRLPHKKMGARSGKSIPFIPLHKHEPGTPHFMDRLREGGKAVTRKLSAVFPGSRGTRAPAPSAAESDDHLAEDRLSERQTSMTVSPIEFLDPLAHVSGSRRSHRDACSEDHQPHTCENDLSPKISPSQP